MFSALQLAGFTVAQIRRCGQALGCGVGSISDLIQAWRRYMQSQGQWQPNRYEDYSPVAVDLTAFWRPRVPSLAETRDYEEALTVAQQGRQLAQAHDLVLVSFINLLALGTVYWALLAPAAARSAHLEAAVLGERAQSASFAGMVAAQLCADCALAGEWEEATAYAREALSYRNYDVLPLGFSPRWPETEALLRGGDVELAHEDVRRWGELVGHIPRFRVPHLRSLAVLAEWDGNIKQAITHLEEALSLAEEIGLPGERWPILAKLGELYQKRGNEE